MKMSQTSISDLAVGIIRVIIAILLIKIFVRQVLQPIAIKAII